MPERCRAILVRVSPEERHLIRERASACERGASTYLRDLALGHEPKVPRGRIEQKAVYHLARIGNNLNQLARHANASRRVELSRRLDEVLAELLDAIRRLA